MSSKTTDLVTWPLKHKLAESMEYTNAWFIQQGVTPVDSFGSIRLYCCKYYLYEHISTYLCIIQETKSWYANYKIQYWIFQSSAKFVHGKYQKTNLVHLYINLVETFALILNSKFVFKYHLWLKLSILKTTLYAPNPLLIHTKKQTYSF